MKETKEIFISYASKDYKLAKELYDYLTGRGLSCWIAPVEAQKEAGEQYGLIIMQAIKKCKIMIVIFNKNANESRFVASEVERAFTYQKIIIPFKTDNAVPSDELEVFLGPKQWLLAAEGRMDDHFKAVYLICWRLLKEEPPPPPPVKLINFKRIVFVTLGIFVLVMCGIFLLRKRSSCPENPIEFQTYISQTETEIISTALTLVEKDNLAFTPYYFSKKIGRVRDTIIARRMEAGKYKSLKPSCRESLKGQMTSIILRDSAVMVDSTISWLLLSRINKLDGDDSNFEHSVDSIQELFRIAKNVSVAYKDVNSEQGINMGSKNLSVGLAGILRDREYLGFKFIKIIFLETSSQDSAHYISKLIFIKK